MTSKTLALAAKEAFKQLEPVLGDPCPSCASTRPGAEPWRKGGCGWSWGHNDELPGDLVTSPWLLQVSASAAADAQPAVGSVLSRDSLQVPQLRTACESLRVLSSGRSAVCCWLRCMRLAGPGTRVADQAARKLSEALRLRAGPKAALMCGLLDRFWLSSPASASHKLVFHYKMHDYILAQWARELAVSSHRQLCHGFSISDRWLCTPHQQLPIQSWPAHLSHLSQYLARQPAVTAAGRDVLAGTFGSWAAMQQAVAAARMAPGPSFQL